MDQWVKWAKLAARPGDRSLIPRTYTEERRRTLAPTNCPLTSTWHHGMCTQAQMNVNKLKNLISLFDQS